MAKHQTADDIFKLIKDEKVEYVDIRFCDLPGVVQHFSIPAPTATIRARPPWGKDRV